MDPDLYLPLAAFGVAVVLRLFGPTRRLLWPINIFAIFVHELCHGLAAILSGGSFESFRMEGDGGVAYTRGGRRFLVIPAGYVGTAFFGAGLMLAANAVANPGVVALALGAIFAALTLLFSGMHIRKLTVLELLVALLVLGAAAGLLATGGDSAVQRGGGIVLAAIGGLLFVRFISDEHFFAVAVGVLSSLALAILGIYGDEQPDLVRFILNFLAFMVGLNTIYDSWYLFHLISDARSARGNDADSMAREIGGAPWLWAGLWSLNAVIVLGVAVWLTTRL